ncbi:phage tail assembly protein T [Massilia sp. DWR3-1-1]|uniref:phage tail assembly protein T n=1 Tax=Massilia sp. DWR3-1-1 TaxID=2804559 RepID=UPI003CFA53C3
MTSAEFTEWQAFYELEPFGGPVEDRRHGVATALFANSQRGSGSEPFKAEDFMYGREAQAPADDKEPTLLADPVAQSNLIRASMFGLPPRDSPAA